MASDTGDWTTTDLDAIGGAGEIGVAPRRRDGTRRPFTTIWVVRVGDGIYVRSFRGPGASWYRAARASGRGRVRAAGVERDVAFRPAAGDGDAIDAAYRAKYARSSYAEAMVTGDVAATTLRLVPDEPDGPG